MTGFVRGLSGGIGIVSLAFVLLGAGLAYTRTIPSQAGFGLFALGCLLGVVSSIAGVVMVVRSGLSPAAAFALCGAPPALLLLYSLVSTRGYPLINDISTSLVYPPQFEHALTLPANADRDMTFPDEFKEIVSDSYPNLSSLASNRDVDDMLVRALEVARSQDGWEVTNTVVGEKESSFEGHSESRVFGFVDDFVIRITRVDEGGCVVDMRSKSREGKGDLGVNAARIKDFLARLEGS